MTGPDLAKLRTLAEAATPIPDFPGYRVDADGNVYSCIPWRGQPVRVLAHSPNSDGYASVRILDDQGRRKRIVVHRLVAEAFLPPKHHDQQMRHLNGNPMDARLSNLAWGTGKENAADRDRHGTTARGERNGYSKLTAEQVEAIRADGRSHRSIAATFGVCQTTISNIKRGIWWKN